MASSRICEICKQPIDPDRAEGLPDTRLCGPHAEEIAKFGGEFKLEAAQERTSKAGSMKINYGGVATRKTRNHAAIDQLRDAYERRR
jgi:hypothetical protein